MSKYCKEYNLPVTYLDCMDCDDKKCRQTKHKTRESVEKMNNRTACKYGRSMISKDCNICTNYGLCDLTRKGEKNDKKKRYKTGHGAGRVLRVR